MAKKRLYLLDATAFCYRAFYALSQLSTSFGQPTNAVYGFLNILNKILKEEKPEYLACCFDISRDTFRQKKFAEYKMQRPAMPDGLSSQIPLIKEIVRAYGIKILEKEGFEADDIIATMASQAQQDNFSVTIVSSDKDILQLVAEDILVFNPYKEEGITYDVSKVKERFGVLPEYIPDIIALMGDSVDNIPGVPGIGEKTAVELIKSAGSLEKLLSGIDQLKQEKLKSALLEHKGRIMLNQELAFLDDKVDLGLVIDDLKISPPDYVELARIFKYLEFRKLLKELPVSGNALAQEKIELTEFKGRAFKEKPEEIFLLVDYAGNLAFSLGKEFFRLEEVSPELKPILEDSRVKKTGHDLKALKIVLASQGIKLSGLYFDTMIAGYLLNPSKAGFDLADLALDYLDQAPTLEEFNPASALELIIKLKPELEKLLREKQLSNLFGEVEMPLVDVLAKMELAGIKIDLKSLKELGSYLEKRLIKLIEDIYAASGTQFNINSTKQLREVLFEKLKLPVIKKGKTGPSTDEEVLNKLAKSHQLPQLLLEYRQLMKLKTTYVDALPELVDPRTGLIHASFNQTGTETGRLSSSNPNLQNLPIKTDIGAKIRQAVVAKDDDSILLACDYSQIELRILAHISEDDNLISAFNAGKDIHKATAALIYGTSEAQVNSQMRDLAKRVNFSIVYGLTAFGLAKDLNIPLEQAQAFIEAYFSRYPKVKEYIDSSIKACEKDGFVTTILGRRRYIPEINNRNQAIRGFAQRQAVNTPIQGSASDLIKLAMIAIDRAIEKDNFKSQMLIQIHDELVFNVPHKEAESFCALVKDKMENVLKLKVPVLVSVKKGRNWLEAE